MKTNYQKENYERNKSMNKTNSVLINQTLNWQKRYRPWRTITTDKQVRPARNVEISPDQPAREILATMELIQPEEQLQRCWVAGSNNVRNNDRKYGMNWRWPSRTHQTKKDCPERTNKRRLSSMSAEIISERFEKTCWREKTCRPVTRDQNRPSKIIAGVGHETRRDQKSIDSALMNQPRSGQGRYEQHQSLNGSQESWFKLTSCWCQHNSLYVLSSFSSDSRCSNTKLKIQIWIKDKRNWRKE